MPRLGRVYFNINYVVDLDNKEMVAEAKQCVFEDVMNAVKNDELVANIKVTADPAADPNDIPEFLRDHDNDDEMD